MFGERINPITNKKEFHDGIDIGAPDGTKVLAIADGIIKSKGNSSGFGNFIVYEINYKKNKYQITCAHLKKILVKEKEKIKQNQVIALAGHTGMATGSHLHFSIKSQNKLIDPIDFVDLPYTEEVKQKFLVQKNKIK